MQNLAVSHTVCAHTGDPQNLGYDGASPPRDGGLEGVADPLETHFSTICVTVPSLVILGQSK